MGHRHWWSWWFTSNLPPIIFFQILLDYTTSECPLYQAKFFVTVTDVLERPPLLISAMTHAVPFPDWNTQRDNITQCAVSWTHSTMRVAFVIAVANGKAKVHRPVRHPGRNSRAAHSTGRKKWPMGTHYRWPPAWRCNTVSSTGKVGQQQGTSLTSFDAFGILLLK